VKVPGQDVALIGQLGILSVSARPTIKHTWAPPKGLDQLVIVVALNVVGASREQVESLEEQPSSYVG